MIAGEELEGDGAGEMEVSVGEETRSQESEPHRETEAVGDVNGYQAGREQGGLGEVTQAEAEDRAHGDTDIGVIGSSGDPGTEPEETAIGDQDGSADRVEEVVETDEVLSFYLGEFLF